MKLIAFVLFGLPATVAAQDPLASHDASARHAVAAFLDYDASVPLHADVVSIDRALGFTREKVVLTGGARDRVPGLLALPDGVGPFPVVLLLHAGAGTKDTWWEPDGLERGSALTEGLLDAGYAVFALDGEHHGERAGSVGYVPITTWYFEHEWWATFRSMVAETVTDYRRVLDYMETRSDLDVSAVGVVGVSMGGITAVALASVDSRVNTIVSASAALTPEWLFPLTHPNLAPTLSGRRVLTIVGDNDELVQVSSAERFHESLSTDSKVLHVYEGGHRPPVEWISLAVDWIAGR